MSAPSTNVNEGATGKVWRSSTGPTDRPVLIAQATAGSAGGVGSRTGTGAGPTTGTGAGSTLGTGPLTTDTGLGPTPGTDMAPAMGREARTNGMNGAVRSTLEPNAGSLGTGMGTGNGKGTGNGTGTGTGAGTGTGMSTGGAGSGL
jgi:hypothetical protein